MDESALAQEDDAVAHTLHLGEDVRAEQDGLPAPPGRRDLFEQHVAHGRVEGVGRLVHDDQGRAWGEDLQQGDLPFHAAGQVGDGAVQVDVECGGEAERVIVGRRAADLAQEVDQLPARHVFVQAQLGGQVGDVPACGDAIGPAVVALDAGGACGGAEEAHDEAEGGGLAGAVGPEQADDLAGADGDGEGVEGGERPVAFG
jgi:hypothetical protein